MLKPFSRTLLALALLSPLTAQAQQGDAARQKELEAARTDLRRAAQRVPRLRKGRPQCLPRRPAAAGSRLRSGRRSPMNGARLDHRASYRTRSR